MKKLLHKAMSKQHLLKAMNNLWAASFDAARFSDERDLLFYGDYVC